MTDKDSLQNFSVFSALNFFPVARRLTSVPSSKHVQHLSPVHICG